MQDRIKEIKNGNFRLQYWERVVRLSLLEKLVFLRIDLMEGGIIWKKHAHRKNLTEINLI